MDMQTGYARQMLPIFGAAHVMGMRTFWQTAAGRFIFVLNLPTV